jgi:hypothetical protein
MSHYANIAVAIGAALTLGACSLNTGSPAPVAAAPQPSTVVVQQPSAPPPSTIVVHPATY